MAGWFSYPLVILGCRVCNRSTVVELRSICQSPHSRLRRQCGVIDDVTARAVNIAGFQFITLIRHLTHNRASGCNFINPALTTSVAKSATWGPVKHPNNYNRASGCRFSNKGNSRPVRHYRGGRGPWVTLRSPMAKSRRRVPTGSRPPRTHLCQVRGRLGIR